MQNVYNSPAEAQHTLVSFDQSLSAASFQRCVFKTAANRVAPVREAVISVPTRSRSRTR